MTTDATITIPTTAAASVDTPSSGVREFVDTDGVLKGKQTTGLVIAPYTGKAVASSHGTPWFDIAAYGTVDRTGTASCDAAVIAAMTAIAASPRGGVLYLGPGVFNISTAVVDFSTGVGNTANPVSVQGSDRGISVIVPNGTGDVIKLHTGADGCSVKHLSVFSSGATQTAGNAVNTNGAHDVLLDDVLFNNQFIDLNVQGGSIKVNLTHAVHTHGVANGANSVAVSVTNGVAGDTYIGPDVVMTDAAATRRRACVEVVQSGHFEINQANLTGSAQGLLVDPGAGQIVADAFINETLFDSNTVNGVTLNAATTTSTIKSFEFVNSWFSGTVTGAGQAGFLSTGAAGGILNGIGFVACRALNNQTHGWQHNFGTDFSWTKCRASGNSAAGANANDGLNVAAGVSNWSVIGGKFGGTDGAPTGGNQRWGINVLAGAGDNIAIVAPDLLGNTTGPLSQNATGLNVYVVAGPGLLPNKSLIAQPAAITTTEVVVHQWAVPAGVLQVGTTLRVYARGTIGATAAGTITAKWRAGTAGTIADTQVATTAAAGAATAAVGWEVDGIITVRSVGAGGTMVGNISATVNATAGQLSAQTPTIAYNTTIAGFISFTLIGGGTVPSILVANSLIEVVKP